MNVFYNILVQIVARVAGLLLCLFLMTRLKGVKDILQKENYNKFDYIVVAAFFLFFAIFETVTGVEVNGSIVNIRIITIMASGILFGPFVGITTGVASGLHRFLIDVNGVTSIPCLISSVVAGVVSGAINKKVKKKYMWFVGIIGGIFCESLTMVLIVFMTHPERKGIDIVSQIGLPMILGQFSIGFIVMLIQSIENEKEEVAAKQAKFALDIANKTLPYFRNINENSLKRICEIIEVELKADAVAIIEKEYIRAYVGVGDKEHKIGGKVITEETKEALKNGKIVIKNSGMFDKKSKLKSAIIIPFWENEEVIGALKIYYLHANKISRSLETLAIGLSKIISTLMELSKLEQMKEMATKAELKALQSQINPHFLFNSLNAITSFIRIDPDKARELIINLSSYLRYNIELNDEFINIKKELKQVSDYIQIEKARFGDKLNVIYDIDDDIDVNIPSLTIQPLVENAIVHGILQSRGMGTVKISIKGEEERVRVSIEDDGSGIDEKVIEEIYSNKICKHKIGLKNVYSRIKLTYGEGLIIKRQEKGTKIEFYIRKED
ncbi:LytS/YhcK type 5TM receptor domain-containing protein [Clostridium sp.]|uniref:LytS/YhcK type 5TM receptor domain-containing protein n=1 Tax=Clostridium sp. TaxID=1506 RepID=UPI002FCAF03B